MSAFEGYDGLLVDLDGTVWRGDELIPGAGDALSAGPSAVFATNNASRSASAVAEKLRGLGVPAEAGDVVTSSAAAARRVAESAPEGAAVLVLGTDALVDLVAAEGLRPVFSAEEEPSVVVQGHSPVTGWPQLSEAALALRAGARFVATNLDSSLPSSRGLLVGNGSMVRAVANATGREPECAGKPEPLMYEMAVSSHGWRRPLVVGDRLDTDIAAAARAGYDSLHVLTGVSRAGDLLAAREAERPTFIAPDVGAASRAPLEEFRPRPVEGVEASDDGEGGLVVSAGVGGHEGLLGLVHAAWSLPEPPRAVRGADEDSRRALEGWGL